MDKNKAKNKAIELYYQIKSLNTREKCHVVFRVGKKSFSPKIMDEKTFDIFIKKHPRAYIGAYHI